MNELIEKLKDKKKIQAFGLLSKEEQECLKKAGKNNCLVYTIQGDWKKGTAYFVNVSTYAIKPDYKPEPKFVDLEIYEYKDSFDKKWLGVNRDSNCDFLPYNPTTLHCLPSLPNFEGFWYESDDTTPPNIYVVIGYVAKTISSGKKVYARFRT